ncbi:hypothetical protein ACRALDRAFT_209558 [Sodiomyces alcalophilus JCM 7366]|uniref:uncharacterized protein n=1 Tax=Sodiomyces alcalophilus JCM 7366 TaxID=591952 RepID=UPI0039B44218
MGRMRVAGLMLAVGNARWFQFLKEWKKDARLSNSSWSPFKSLAHSVGLTPRASPGIDRRQVDHWSRTKIGRAIGIRHFTDSPRLTETALPHHRLQ